MSTCEKMSTGQSVWKNGTLVLDSPLSRIVNVSTVPMRSPFRYPGGKTWLVPSVRRWLRSRGERPAELIEPFAGGGTVGLTAAFEGLAEHVTLVELDKDVAAVWRVMLSSDASWLAEQVMSFQPSPRSVESLFSREPLELRERAFATIVKNRVNRGGILAPGAGRLKRGDGGKGMASRWYPETLKRRIMDIHSIGDRLHFIQGDGMSILQGNVHRKDVVFFIDPPYTAAGKKAGLRLYRHTNIDHEALFNAVDHIEGDFLMTYDDTEEIQELAMRHGFQVVHVPMKSTHHTKMTELLVGRNLGWTGERRLS